MQPTIEPHRPDLLRRPERRPQRPTIGPPTNTPEEQLPREDPIDRASRDSFPASDPPAWIDRRQRR